MSAFKAQIEHAILICQIDKEISNFALRNGILNFKSEVAIRDENWVKKVLPPAGAQSIGKASLFEIVIELGQEVTKRIEERKAEQLKVDVLDPSIKKGPDKQDKFEP